jgi:hypothetical protein
MLRGLAIGDWEKISGYFALKDVGGHNADSHFTRLRGPPVAATDQARPAAEFRA